jgi:hypothetical protein
MSDAAFRELRGHFDGSEGFMTRGHQIIRPHKGGRQTPTWARTNASIQKILLRAFPRLKDDPKQRASAARWAALIQLYFRVLMSYKQAGEQMGITPQAAKRMAQRIQRLANDLSIGYRGRPKALRK